MLSKFFLARREENQNSISASLASSASSASSAPSSLNGGARLDEFKAPTTMEYDETEYRASKAAILEAAKEAHPGELQPIATSYDCCCRRRLHPHSATAQVPHAHAATSPLAAEL